jgi:signal transduction histidine kinase
VIAFPLLAAVLFFALRRRILLPLRNLGNFMTLLSQQHYRSFPIDDAEPILLPLFTNYNQMVSRLAELERENRAQRQTLEHDVRTATEALLAQQRSLARAERLAAVGEIAAGLAHELRNPLAGVQMALGNLRSEVAEPEHVRRLDLMINELKRVVRLLNDALSQSRQPPEPPVDVDIHLAVSELAALTGYQIPPQVKIECDIPPELRCRLPEGTLRQAVLNLILNAAQAIGEDPGTITLQARCHHDMLELSVSDDGPGFPSALLDNGARSFATWRDDGTGLGLAMVRRFVHDLGGELRLSNRETRGACVALTLPCKDHDG